MATNISVRARRGEHPEKTIRRFIRKVKKSGILDEVRDRRYYTKPSDKKRREKAKRKRKAKQTKK
mgnify:CR=1 FL=1|tara:strand:+ start:390 stop:584 length:195 start_codon:yes stop_codon:yes gene_type:complete